MTIDDALVIGGGSILLLILFLSVQMIRFDGWAVIRRYVLVRVADMSSWVDTGDAGDADGERTVSPVVTAFTTSEQPIVTPNNEYNRGLSDNERIAFETTAKSIALMYEKGVVTNLSKAVCAAYGCSVQSAAKTDSTYQMALKAVNKHLPKKDVPQFRMSPEQEAARDALGLN